MNICLLESLRAKEVNMKSCRNNIHTILHVIYQTKIKPNDQATPYVIKVLVVERIIILVYITAQKLQENECG